MNLRYWVSAVLIAGLFAPPAMGAAESSLAAESEMQLNPIVVTATRAPQHESETLAATTVITRKEIERLQPHSVQEMLRWAPGVNVTNMGGAGRLTSIFMRGTKSNHTVVLINGVRYDDISSGIAAIQDIPVSHIKRIEIVRGPYSSLYGSDAVGGVIQIFTRNGENTDEPAQPHISVGTGTNDTYAATAGLSGNTDRAHYNVSVSHKATNGFNACRGKPAPNGGGCFVDQPDDDGYQRTAGSLRAGYRLSDTVEVSAHAMRVESKVQFDGSQFSGDITENLRQVLGASVTADLTEMWQMQVSAGYERNETDNYFNGAHVNRIDSSITSLRWQNTLELSPANRFTFGVDYREEQIDSSDDFSRTEQDATGVYAQYQGRFGPHQLRLALRGDDYEAFDDPVTGSIAYGWHLDSVHTITVSYGTAFSTPTFVDLYFPYSSNAKLEPEESESFEIGFKTQRNWGHWAVHAYQTTIDNLIVLDSTFTPQNISKARIRGVEASIDADFGPWYVNASASYVDSENRSDTSYRDNQLARHPEYSAKLRLGRQLGRFSLGGSIKYGGSRYEDRANTVKLDDFVLVGLRGSWNVTDAFEVQARVDNLFDANYETVRYYNQPGRSVFVSLKYHP